MLFDPQIKLEIGVYLDFGKKKRSIFFFRGRTPVFWSSYMQIIFLLQINVHPLWGHHIPKYHEASLIKNPRKEVEREGWLWMKNHDFFPLLIQKINRLPSNFEH